MNKKILLLSVVLGFSAMSNASEPKYAFLNRISLLYQKLKSKMLLWIQRNMGMGKC